jgi:site-specific DNA-methyltransferase (adenine-specific)
VKPYYSDDAVTLYHGDCREILPHVQADVLVTDPPYGIGYQSAWRTERERFDIIAGDDAPSMGWVNEARRCVADGGALYVFTRWDVLPQLLGAMPMSRSCVVWDRVVHGLADVSTCYAPSHDLILMEPVGRHVLRGGRPRDLIRCQRPDPNKLVHPCEKPVGLLAQLIANSTDTGQTVLDPFAGSGTTLRAAKDLGRRAIGIEIEERYCEIAARRCAQEVLPL